MKLVFAHGFVTLKINGDAGADRKGRAVEMGKMVNCASCGGEYDDALSRCPYCGSVNAASAEKEYLEKLKGVQEDMRELGEIPAEELRKTIAKQSRKLWKILAGAAVAIGVLVLIGFVLMPPDSRDYKAEFLWQQEHYPQLNALYDAGKYEEMLELSYELGREKNANLYDWKHYDFCTAYETGLSVLRYIEEDREKPLGKYGLYSLFYGEWYMKGIDIRRKEFTEQEYEALLPMMEAAEADLGVRWDLTEEEYDDFYQQLKANEGRYLSYSQCEEYVKKWLEEKK